MHANARKVVEAASAVGLHIDVVEHPDGTRTADEAARAVGCSVDRIVKSLVFTVGGDPVVALIAGDDRLAVDRLAAVAGGPVERADADLVRSATGFPIGGVPPIGHATDLDVYVDEALLAHTTVWAAAGTPRHVFEVRPADLVASAGAIVASLVGEPTSEG